jgi:uncharacterized delta-60 repeat protein
MQERNRGDSTEDRNMKTPLVRFLALVLLHVVAAPWASSAPSVLDAGFNPDAGGAVYSIAVQSDGRILIGGYFTTVGGQTRNRLARLEANGLLDAGFNPNANNGVNGIAVQTDAKIVVAGGFTDLGGTPRNRVARLNADGTLDVGFNPNADADVHCLALQIDGKILLGGQFTTVGGQPRARIARLNADGTLDTQFTPSPIGSGNVDTIAVQADGKILIGGSFTVVGGVTRHHIARLDANGTLELAFNPDANVAVPCVAVQSDGKILIGGTFTTVGGAGRNHIARLNTDGSIDVGFNPNADGNIDSIALQTDGRIIIGGSFTTVGTIPRSRVARLNADGTVDGGFDPSANGLANSIAVQVDGKVIAGGAFTSMGTLARNRIARLDNDPATQNIVVPNSGSLQWMRGSASPETHQVTFELSTDGGTTWSLLGMGARIPGGWGLGGLGLPGSGRIRARARTVSGNFNGSSGMIEATQDFTTCTPQMLVRGRSVTIPDGDTNPTGNNDTDFFEIPVCGASVTHPFTIFNFGTCPLTVTGIISSNPAEFVVGSPLVPFIIPAGGVWQDFTVTFDPSGPGSRTATISLVSDDSTTSPYTFTVAGTGSVTASALGLVCAASKTVACGSNWSFDPPSVTGAGAAGPPPVTVVQTLTNGICPQVVTRTWQVVDACGITTTCSQSVTIVDDVVPTLTCATNKLVLCGTFWEFDPPLVVDSCGVTNVSLTVLGTITNGLSPLVITRTWQAVDACHNTNTCSQTVTVLDSAPETLSVDGNANIFGAGLNSPPVPQNGSGAGILPPVHAFPAGPGKVLDFLSVTGSSSMTHPMVSGGPEGYFNVTYTDVDSWGGISGIRHDGAGFLVGVFLDANVPGSPAPSELDFRGSILGTSATNFCRLAPLIGQTFYIGDGQISSGGIQQFEVPPTATRLFLGFADANGYHGPPGDYQDNGGSFTATFQVRQKYACSTDKTVSCGAPWEFDPPTVPNGCSGTNGLVVTVLSTTTNGVAAANATVITRTWQVVDGCGSTNTCSQSVTVLNLAPPSIACPSDITVAASSAGSVVTFAVPVVTGGVLASVTPPSGSVFPVGTTQVTCTATNACGVSTCSFRVTVVNPCATGVVSLNSGYNHGTNGLYSIGMADSFWTVISDPDPGTTEPRPATVIQRNTAWSQAMTNSQWISSYASAANDRNGFYEFQTRFCLGAGWSNAVLQLALRADDRASVFLNNQLIGGTPTSGSFNSSQPTTIVVTDQTKFMTGSNLLLVRVENVYSVAMGLNLTGSMGADGLSVDRPECCQGGSSIGGQKFNDQNGNGLRDTGEPVLPGWTIQLASGTNFWTTLTDTNGYYYFMSLAPGAYTVTEQQVAGWVQTAPAGGSHGVTLVQAQAVNGVNFGNRRGACLDVICPTNKTVQCGSEWAFDPPSATTCCGTSITIQSAGIVTNGVCPRVITQQWLVTDGCGTTNLCRQTVTVVDDSPPQVQCPKGPVVVALDALCRLEIPAIRPAATDGCTPADGLVYTQDPSPGAFVDGRCHWVRITVRDACGNVTRCEVEVCGKDRTPPVVIPPKSIAARDCVVPDVRDLVSAMDNCTSPNLLVFEQSPPPGTPIAAGGNLVSVTVTDEAGNSTTVQIPLTTPNQQSFLNVLFNTGVDASKTLLLTNAIDPNYTLGPVPSGTPIGSGFYNPPNAIAVGGPWWLPPVPPGTVSQWIAPADRADLPTGTYIYTNRFVLPAGADPLTASISGRWAADDGGALFLNGLAIGNRKSTVSTMSPSGFTQWTPFIINNGFVGFPAVNTLYFVVTNIARAKPNYTGLRVEFTNAVIHCAKCTPPSIGHGGPKQLYPLNGTAVFNVSVWGTPPLTIQWNRNNQPLSNGGHYSGVDTATLTVSPVAFADAGTYHAVISNPCGQVTSGPRKLSISKPWGPWTWAEWGFSRWGKPLVADFGPELGVVGPHPLGVSSGTTRDFGLPNLGGNIVNVMHVPPWPRDTFLMLPPWWSGTNAVKSHTLILDVHVPMQRTHRMTLFTRQDISSSILLAIEPASNSIKAEGNVDRRPFTLTSTNYLRPGDWNRIAMVVDGAAGPAMNTGKDSLALYLNGKPAGRTPLESASGGLALRTDSLMTLLSSTEGTASGVYVADIQCHAIAFSPEMIATVGSPEDRAIPVVDLASEALPVLSVTNAGGRIELRWKGSFVLEETSDLKAGTWKESFLPFDQCCVEAGILNTANAKSEEQGSPKFYRLNQP